MGARASSGREAAANSMAEVLVERGRESSGSESTRGRNERRRGSGTGLGVAGGDGRTTPATLPASRTAGGVREQGAHAMRAAVRFRAQIGPGRAADGLERASSGGG